VPHSRIYPQDGQELAADLAARGIRSPEVLRAMRTVPRQAFVLPDYTYEAYADRPLPIACGQTISQPYMVAAMTELLALCPGERVLEVGTGSGYQTAILAELGSVEVYTVEIIQALADEAAARFQALGYSQIHLQHGDGYHGWPEHAPYNGIIVTAAVEQVPPPLPQQLTEGGRLVIPIGAPRSYQSLWVYTKQGGELKGYNWGGVAFVPFTREKPNQ
jgi:protein-L-isoaspartate(D-aspartate) O-methyltransferase